MRVPGCGRLSCPLAALMMTGCVGSAVGDSIADSSARDGSDGGLAVAPDVSDNSDLSVNPADSGGGGTAAWRPFSDASPWNTRIASGAALDPNSAQLIADFAAVPGQDTFWMNIQDFSIPVYWVDSAVTPSVTVNAELGGAGFRTGAPNDGAAAGSGPAPIPSNAMAAAGTDRHLLIVDRKTKMEWGFFDAAKSNAGAAGWTAAVGATLDLSGTGIRPPEHSTPWWAGHGARACGFGLIAGLITTDEIKGGRIDHALVVAYPHIRSRYYTSPASTAQGTFGDAQPNRGIMCGGRIQLDPALDITKLGLSPVGVVIARALQEYGAFVGDYSGAMSLYADSSPEAMAYWKTGVLDNETAGKIPLNRFRVLQIGVSFDNMN